MTSIELATKILDCKERIRNTLSHEMCHLACWIINQDPKEGHGKIWKSWWVTIFWVWGTYPEDDLPLLVGRQK
jgi:predicted SprT family Zn-dependent metalloprotease